MSGLKKNNGVELMIVAALIKKIISLFLIMFSGALLVRLKILKAGDSKVLSVLTL